jgi:hypothetical protein
MQSEDNDYNAFHLDYWSILVDVTADVESVLVNMQCNVQPRFLQKL